MMRRVMSFKPRLMNRQINFRIDDELRTRLNAEASKLKTTPSQIVREALVRELERRKRRAASDCAAEGNGCH